MGYLDHYGEGEERREKLIKRAILAAIVVLIAGSVLYYLFKNFRQEHQVKHFYALLGEKNYAAAYVLWGCSQDKPCRDYSYQRFLDDWGPNSPNVKASAVEIVKSRSCGSGVIITVKLGDREEKLWVDRESLVMGYSPWPTCPASGR